MARSPYVGALAIWVLAASASAERPKTVVKDATSGGGVPSIELVSGGMQTGIPIAVPPYHGIEPQLGLHYSSDAGNGWLGVGWSLRGASVIERVSLGRGAAWFTDSTRDTFVLDGEELWPCGDGIEGPCGLAKPSEAISFVGKVGDHRRALLFPTADGTDVDRFEVQNGDGTKATYTSIRNVLPPGAGFRGVRWGVSRVEDAHGNVVTYEWTLLGDGAHPRRIAYNGNEVQFEWELRPVADQEKKANGTSLDASPFRLKEVVVLASGAQRNRYRLKYDEGDALSPSTQRSRLRQVQVCGKSDSLCLPAMNYEYVEQPRPNELSTGTIEGIDGFCASGSLTTGDFTGDGRTDFACMSKTFAPDRWEVRIDVAKALVDGTGFELPVDPWFVSYNAPPYNAFIWCLDSNEIRSADFNADGRTDLYCPHNPGAIAHTPLLSRGFDFVDGGLGYHAACGGGIRWAADFTGDGAAEQYCIAGGGASGGASVSSGWCSGAGKIGEGDFNGDGRTDLYCHEPGTIDSPLGRVFVALSQANPGDTGAAMLQDPNFWIDGFCSGFEADVGTGDFNGDGKADLYCVKTGGDGGTEVALSVGRGRFERLATNLPSPPVGNLIADPPMDTTFWDTANFCDGHSWWYRGPDLTGDDGTPPADPSRGSVLGSGRSANVWDGWCYKSNVFRGLPGRRTYRVRFDMSVKIISRPPGWGRSGRFLVVSNDGSVLWADTGWIGDSDWAPRTLIIPNVDLSQGAGVAIWNSHSSNTLTYTLVDNLFVTQTDVPIVADFNGDGKDDLYYQQDEGSILVSLSTGAGPSPLEAWAAGFCPAGGWLSRGDFDGDGKEDLYCYRTENGEPRIEIARSGDYGMTDMLRRIENGLGGTTEIEYRPSSVWGEPSFEEPTGLSVLPQTTGGPIRQTVLSTVTEDGRGNSYANEYRYAGHRHSWVERMGLGFRMVEIRRCREPNSGGDCPGPYTQSWQGRRLAPFQPGSLALVGRSQTELVLRFSEQGQRLAESRVRTAGFAGFPQQLVPEGRFETVENAKGDRRVTLETFSHDGLGQLLRRIQYGECVLPLGSDSCDGVAGSGDELTTVVAYRPADGMSYLAGLPERVTTYVGAHADLTHEPPAAMRLAETLREYFDNGDLLKTREWLDSRDPVEYVETGFAYDGFGNLTEVTDASNARTTTFFDATHHVYPIGVLNGLAEKNGRGHTVSIDYDLVCGLPRSETNLNDVTIVTDHDELCRPTVTQGPGLYVSRQYTLGSALINRVRTEAQGRWSEEHFDGLGRVYKTLAEGSLETEVTEVTFDSLGRVQTSSEPGLGAAGPATSFVYDDLDRLICAAQPGGTCSDAPGPRVWTSYDLRTVTLTDERNRRRESVYDAYGRLQRRIEYADEAETQPVTTNYLYEWLPRRTTIRSPAGHDMVATSDSLGRVVVSQHPDRGVETFRYDARGLLVESVDAAGLVHWRTHDAVRRPRAQGYRAAGANVTTAELQYGRDLPQRGRIELAISRDDAGTEQYREQYAYDLAGRVKERVAYAGGLAFSFDYEYRADNEQLWFIRYPNQKRLSFSYDPALRIERVELDGQLIVDKAIYDALGRLTEQRNGNGTSSLVRYDPARGWLTGIRTLGPQGAIQDLAYVHDDVGNVLARESGVPDEPTWVYQYTAQDFLSSAASSGGASQSFSYDPLTGNLTSGPLGTYQYGDNAGPHAVTSIVGGTSMRFEYDGRGNMRSRNGAPLEHDVAGRLVRAGAGPEEKRFGYEALGGRVKKCDADGCTWYLGDGYEKRIPAAAGATQ